MTIELIVPTLLFVATAFALPVWPYSREWGYFPAVVLFGTMAVLIGSLFLRPVF
jgi:Protein of unknown function (DUF3309)